MLGPKYLRNFVNINIMSNSFLILSPRIPDAQEADASSSSRSSQWPPSTTETRAPAATTSASGWSGSETGWTGASTADTLTFSPTGATTPAWCRGAFVVSILEINCLHPVQCQIHHLQFQFENMLFIVSARMVTVDLETASAG